MTTRLVKKTVVIAICAAMLTGCSGNQASNPDDGSVKGNQMESSEQSGSSDNQGEGNKQSQSADQTATGQQEESGNTESDSNQGTDGQQDQYDNQAQAEETTQQNLALYEEFLANNAKVHIDPDRDIGEYFSFDGSMQQDCTLEEIVNAIIAGYISDNENSKISLEGIEYAYIDCGNDGEKELALLISTPEPNEGWLEYMVIKDFDGELRSVYSNMAWSRRSLYFNEYGFIFGDGSGGAAYHSFDKEYIDADGTCHFVYSDSSTDGLAYDEYSPSLWFNGDSHELPDSLELDGSYVFLGFDFTGDKTDENYDYYTYAKIADNPDDEWDNGFRGYFYSNLEKDNSIYADTHPLKRFFDNEGLHIYTLDEIDKMIADKEASLGITEEIKNGKGAEWKELTYDFEPNIPNLNANNFLERKEYFPLSFLLTNDQNGANTSLRINSDGTIEGSYSDWNYNNATGSSVTYKNDFTGKFTVTDKLSNDIYELKISDYKVANEVGTSESNEYTPGSISEIYYVDVPGFDDGGTTYRLFCPGAQLAQINDAVYSQLPDYFREDAFENDVLTKYILFGMDGNNYLWRFFN